MSIHTIYNCYSNMGYIKIFNTMKFITLIYEPFKNFQESALTF